MYYKIVNKDCEVFKKLHELRTKEIAIRKENENAIANKIGLKFRHFLGDNSQQNFRRVPQYSGFKFSNPEKVDLNIWKLDSEHKEFYVPNKRTKAGREMSQFLLNGLQGSLYDNVFKILKLQHQRKFTFPFVEIAGDIIVVYLGQSDEPKDENLIEITKKEFEQIINHAK